ncbi:ribose import ATP-binding protein RbsA [Clostridia bacterium]|nr:ribose import ATP-binding protein RbsA [Clostridia bacterium]
MTFLNFECKGISKQFGAVVALKDVGFSIKEGEVRALLGGNGSGKSTLAKVIAGAVKPDSGNITAFDAEFMPSSPDEAKKHHIIMTSQELSLFSNLSVAQNLSFCTIPVKGGLITDNKKILSVAKDILSELNVLHLLDKRIDELAPNEKYMIEYAKALVQDPRLLIIDEITSALYKKDVEIIKASIEKVKNNGCSVIFISHRLPEIFDICETVTVMRSGAVVADMEVANASEQELISLMTGKTITKEDADKRFQDAQTETQGKTILSISDLKLSGFESTLGIDIGEGEIVGVAGLQGHGQSTLVRQLFGLESHMSLTIDGEKTTIRNPRQAVKKGMAFISGDREKEGVFKEQSISENLRVVGDIILKKRQKNVGEILDRYHVVYGNTGHKLVSLSGGNQQKVVISRWTSVFPKIVLADDPTKGIDVQARSEVHQIFKELAEQGSAVLMVSSDDAELVNLAKVTNKSRVIVMYEGKIIKVLRGAEITEENIGHASMPVVRSDEN